MRKRSTKDIEEILNATPRRKMQILMDVTAELREMYGGLVEKGARVWNGCGEPREWLAWYYSEVQDALFDMQNYYETSETYWEMVALYKELFVMFFVSEARDTIYQLGLNGECYMREKGSEWKTCKELSGRLIGVTRTSAEKLEDSWETEDGFTFDEPETGIWTS